MLETSPLGWVVGTKAVTSIASGSKNFKNILHFWKMLGNAKNEIIASYDIKWPYYNLS